MGWNDVVPTNGHPLASPFPAPCYFAHSYAVSDAPDELVLARTNEYTVEEIDLAIHAHPTLSEAIAEAALDSMGKVIHI